eukprot:8897802-Alexandrium_andersonii.AAC.1
MPHRPARAEADCRAAPTAQARSTTLPQGPSQVPAWAARPASADHCPCRLAGSLPAGEQTAQPR